MSQQTQSFGERLRALPTRSKAVAATLAVLLAGLLVLALTLGGGAGDDSDTGAVTQSGEGASDGSSPNGDAPGPTPTDADGTPRPTPEPGQTEPTPVETPETPQALPEPVRVPLGEPADLENGVTVRVTDIESVQGQGRGVGENSGPALRVTVSVTNDSDEAIGMLSSVVTLSHGPERDPADDLSGPGTRSFPETIDPGDQAAGLFVFAVPAEQRDVIVVDFRYTTEAPTAIFRGSAA